MQFASAQVIRIITDKVLENVSRQMTTRTGSAEAQTIAQVDPELIARLVARHFEVNAGELIERFDSVASKTDRVDARLTKLERRWGWRMLFRFASIVVLAVLVGFVVGVLARSGGWI